MVAPLLEATNVVRSYGGRTVVDVAELTLRRGEVLSITGPNGAGKSTLFRLLLLLERPDRGEIRIDGRPADGTSRRLLAGVFQRPILFSGTVASNVAYGLRARRLARDEQRRRTREALEAVGMVEYSDAPVHTLSGGEAQRVALARALALEPAVLLLDEPTASLDISVRRRFRHDLERAGRQRAGAILLVTHDAGEAFGLADRVAVMHHGRIVQEGTPTEVMLRPASPFAAELSGAELLLHGRVEARDDGLAAIRIAGTVLLWATAAETAAQGTRAVVGYRPEDIVLSVRTDDVATSAVNRIEVVVRRVVPAGALVRVLLEAHGGAVLLTALLTRRSADALALEPGAAAIAHMKATALHAWAE